MNENRNYRTVSEVIEQASQFVAVNSADNLSRSVIESVKWAFRAIKSEAAERHLCEAKIDHFTATTGAIQMPVETLRVVDVGISNLSLRESVGPDGRFKSRTLSRRFTRYGNTITLTDGRSFRGIITVTSYKIPTDPQGEILVPDELFMGVVYDVAAKEALGRASSNPQLFALFDRMRILAGNSVDSARANANSAGWNETLDFMASIRRNFKTDYDL